MATKIVTKNSSTASAVPTASDLVQGELAVNVADKRLFTEDNAGAIVELGTNPSGNVTFQDNGKAIFGAGSDLQIYHDGSHSYVGDYGTGNLSVTGNNLYLQNTSGETYLSGISDGAVSLYHNNAEKLATTSTGINVTGNLTMASGGSIVAGGANDLILNAGESGTPDIYLQSGGSTKVKIEGSNGNVGIAGQTNPTYKIDGGFADQTWGWYLNSGYNAGITYTTSDRSLLIHTKSAEALDHIKFATGTAATERMRIDSSGNVGIGTAPVSALSIKRGVGANAYIEVAGNNNALGSASMLFGQDGSNYGYCWNRANEAVLFGTNQIERMRIDASGNLLVGATASAAGARLEVTENAGNLVWFGNSSGTGLYMVAGGTAWVTSSDERVKDIIEPISGAIAKLSTLRTVIGKYKTDNQGVRRPFLIAQDLQAVFPEAVNEQEDELKTLGVEYSSLIPLLIAGMKEQQNLIESLTARVAALEE